MRPVSATVVALLLCLASARSSGAQSLTVGLFERYLDALRQELAIPGLSAAIVQDGRIVWDHGFGYRDLATSSAATATTPYPVANLSETVGAALLLQQCVDFGDLELADRVQRWTTFPETTATIGQFLAHLQPSGVYHYDPGRFALLSNVVEQCVKQPYARVVTEQIIDRLGMVDSVPGIDAVDPDHPARFSAAHRARYAAVLDRMAVPYRVDSKGTPTRSAGVAPGLNASTGIISTVRDLARFDAALADGVLLTPSSLAASWTAGAGRPTGLGWFVQSYNGERLVWHFGSAPNAYSSLVLKLPGRRLTLILLANSDGLGSSFVPANGDVTGSLFARLFLRLFVS